MKKAFLFLSLLGTITTQAQIFKQNFEGPANQILNYVTTDSSQFNDAGPIASGGSDGANVVTNHGSKKMQMVRTSTNSFFARKYVGYDVNKNQMYGALIGGLDNPAYVNKPIVARKLGIIYLRDGLTINDRGTWTNKMYDSGFKMVITANWNKDTLNPVPFPTDTVAYKDSLTAAFTNGIIPAALFIENEENNTLPNYHTGTAIQYLNELRAATTVAHTKGFKIGNGGITSQVTRYLTYHYYADTSSPGYDTAKASSFKARTPKTNYLNPNLIARGKFEDTVVKAFATMAIDYVNFHWYGGTLRDGQTDVMGECIAYLRAVTGKTIVTNELGQYNLDTATTDSLLKATRDYNLPLVMWYDNDGDPALALNETNDTLRATGIAFRNYLATNNLNYSAPQFISVIFNLRDTLSTTGTTTGNTFSVGNGLTIDANDDISGNIHSQLAIMHTNDGKFRIKDLQSGNLYPTSGNPGLSGEQTIKWYINNSGSSKSYTGPDGNPYTLSNDKWDVFVKAVSGGSWVKAYSGSKNAVTGTARLEDFKFIFNNGSATLFFDDIQVYDEINHASPKGIYYPANNELQTSKLKVYAGDQDMVKIFFTAEEQSNTLVTIYDINGREIARAAYDMQEGSNTCNLQARLAPGVYIAKLQTSYGTFIHKFMK